MNATVVGGGLAGCVAALTLAERGAQVTLLRAAPGATALCSGVLEVAGPSPLSDGLPVRDPLRGTALSPAERLHLLCRRRPAHPYARLREPLAADPGAADAAVAKAVHEAALALDGWLAPSGLRVEGDLETTRWLADVRGALRGGDLALTGAAEGAIDGASELVLVDVPGLAHHDARPAAVRLAAELDAVGLDAPPVRTAVLELPENLLDPGGSPARLAARLDEPAGRTVLRRAASRLRAAAATRLLLFPPVLGIDGTGELLALLREASGARVAELLGAPPHAPAGLRLDRALTAALARAGVELRVGRVRRLDTTHGRFVAAILAGEERVYADVAVLACGRFVGGGVVERDGGLVEPLLDLPLWSGGARALDHAPPQRALDLDVEAEQPLFAAGVRVDRRLRPISRAGSAAYANVFAAGDLLEGFDPARERTGLGVALATGRRAGLEAASYGAVGGREWDA